MTEQPVQEGQVRPAHYAGQGSPFEPIAYIQYHDLTFELGSVIKYVTRAKLKKTFDEEIRDLEKAKTYIDFEIAKLRAGAS